MSEQGHQSRVVREGAVPSTMRRVITERFGDQHSGQALVMVGIMMMTLIAFVALATDTGFIWMNRRSLQNSADAAALAGVQQLPDGVAGARATACDFAGTKNGVPNMSIDCAGADIQIYQTYAPNDTIKVTVHKTVTPIFGRVLGWNDVRVGATATALIGGVASACVFPLAQTQDLLEAGGVWDGSGVTLNKATVMKIESSGGVPLRLQLNGNPSASVFEDTIGSAIGCGGSVSSDGTTASLGAIAGPVRKGLTDRKALWDAQGNCTDPNPTVYLRADGNMWKFPLGTANNVQLTPETCYRMVKIPVIDVNSAVMDPNTKYDILGISIFYISGWCNSAGGSCAAPIPPLPAGTDALKPGQIWGYYVGLIAAGGTDYTEYNGFGTKVAVLVD